MTPGPHDSGKTVIVGHSRLRRSGEILDLGHLFCIDTFCYGGGWLTALDVKTGEVWQADQGRQDASVTARPSLLSRSGETPSADEANHAIEPW